MKQLLTKKDEYKHYINDITEDIDNYLYDNLKDIKEKYGPRTYLDECIVSNSWLIKYPGHTIGSIITDNKSIITEIHFYNENNIIDKLYNSNVMNCYDKYIGMKIILEE